MASNAELKALLTNTDYQDRVTIALLKKADLVAKDVGSTAPEKAWAASIIATNFPGAEGAKALTQLLLDNSGASNAAIVSVLSDDAQVQTRVNTFIDNYLANLL